MDLYLSSDEYPDFKEPLEIVNYQKVNIEGSDILIARVGRPINSQNFGYGTHAINVFYLVNRHDEKAFRSLNKFPIHVHVLIPKKPGIEVNSFSQLDNIAWASLYANKSDARKHKI